MSFTCLETTTTLSWLSIELHIFGCFRLRVNSITINHPSSPPPHYRVDLVSAKSLYTHGKKRKEIYKETRTDLCTGGNSFQNLFPYLGSFAHHNPKWLENYCHVRSTRPCLCCFYPSLEKPTVKQTKWICYSNHVGKMDVYSSDMEGGSVFPNN